MFKVFRVCIGLAAVLAGCNGTTPEFEDSARRAAAAIGADELTLYDS